jgi:hypothetical protein
MRVLPGGQAAQWWTEWQEQLDTSQPASSHQSQEDDMRDANATTPTQTQTQNDAGTVAQRASCRKAKYSPVYSRQSNTPVA